MLNNYSYCNVTRTNTILGHKSHSKTRFSTNSPLDIIVP